MVTHSFPTKNVYLGLIKKKILGPIAISTALCKNIPRFLLKSENESKCYKLKDIYCEKKLCEAILMKTVLIYSLLSKKIK